MNKRDFKLTDIIVYCGVITQYGVISALINWNDTEVDLRKANLEETSRYYARPEK